MKQEYFPPDMFSDDHCQDEYTNRWYSKVLTGMDEPSLSEASEDLESHAYRFLWLRTFHPDVAVRL